MTNLNSPEMNIMSGMLAIIFFGVNLILIFGFNIPLAALLVVFVIEIIFSFIFYAFVAFLG